MDQRLCGFCAALSLCLGRCLLCHSRQSCFWSIRLESRPVDESTGVRADQIVWLRLLKSIEHYPDRFMRLVSYAA